MGEVEKEESSQSLRKSEKSEKSIKSEEKKSETQDTLIAKARRMLNQASDVISRVDQYNSDSTLIIQRYDSVLQEIDSHVNSIIKTET